MTFLPELCEVYLFFYFEKKMDGFSCFATQTFGGNWEEALHSCYVCRSSCGACKNFRGNL